MAHTYKNISLSIVLLFSGFSSFSFADESQPIITSQKIFNLDYGNALYYLYQQKYFSALTQLKIAKTVSPIKTQGFAPDIIYSGLALRYGINSLASKQLLFLAKSNLSKVEHDQIWFYQAKLNLINTQDSLAETALSQIGSSLPERFIQEKNNLLIEAYIRLNKLENAQQEIDKIEGDDESYFYSRYNLGVAYIRNGNIKQGTKVLTQLGELSSDRNELLALRDKANIALGFSYLRENKAELAISYFTKIRLNGPFSNKGLLGLGWAYVLAGKHKKALTPWVELKSRHTIEPAVQEVLLAIPNSLEKLEQLKAAAGQYEEAITNYKNEVKKLNATLRLIKTGEFMRSLKPTTINDDSDFPWHLTSIPKTETAIYLGQLFGSHSFQVGFENYRSLLYLNYIIQGWSESLPTYRKILNIRQSVYDDRLTEIDLQTSIAKFNKLDSKYKKLLAKLQSIESSDDDMALADSFEYSLIKRFDNLEQAISNETSLDDATQMFEQANRLRAILKWDIKRDYIPRLWSSKQTLIELQKSIDLTAKKKDVVKNSMSSASINFSEYNSRFSQAEKRLSLINAKLQNLLNYQKQQLNTLATKELTRRQILLQGYIDQAQYSLARLFDKLSNEQ
ncbi:hypothetical protein MNBD_GAMMA22-1045 [hydrothermal vent metagenome]|uniref:Uncharacterized protein n=1 Tax=hydrothermal vent metagenome TaxID=652676 RepID=A0A3B1AA31_9ZZZZ